MSYVQFLDVGRRKAKRPTKSWGAYMAPVDYTSLRAELARHGVSEPIIQFLFAPDCRFGLIFASDSEADLEMIGHVRLGPKAEVVFDEP